MSKVSNELTALNRLRNIQWKMSTEPTEEHIDLFGEYLRRTTIWNNATGKRSKYRIFDLAQLFEPNFKLSITVEQEIESMTNIKGEYAVGVCGCYVRWESIKEKYPEFSNLPALYEPLIALYESGGRFSTYKGSFTVGHMMTPIQFLEQ